MQDFQTSCSPISLQKLMWQNKYFTRFLSATSTEKGSSNKETVQESQKKTGSTSRSRLFRKEIPSKEDSMAYETSTITRKRLDSAAMPISLGHSNTETTQIATEKQPSQKNRLTTIIDRPFETPRVQEKEKDSQVEPGKTTVNLIQRTPVYKNGWFRSLFRH